MIQIYKEKDEKVTIKVEKGTKNLEMLMGCVFLVEALKKELNADTDVILSDIKKIVDKEGGEE
jgi:hypothetical protein